MTRNDYYDADEMECVEELRHRLKGMMSPELYEDTTMFIRFLRARNHDLKATEIMLKNHLNWREKHKVDTILDWYIPHPVTKYTCLEPIAIDREGSPVCYLDFGNIDLRGVLNSISMTEVQNYVIHRLEEDIKIMKKRSKENNANIYRWIYVFNFANISLSTVTNKVCVETVMKIFTLYEANYPECLKTALLINTSWIFQLGFAFIKPLLSGPTLQKVKLFGKDDYKEELLKYIDEDELPKLLGGNKAVCNDSFNFNGKDRRVPEEYYVSNNKNQFMTQPDVKKLVVSRMSKQQVELLVPYPNTNIEWEFQTKEKDIFINLTFKSDTECEELISKQRCDTSISPEVGYYKCTKPGIYSLEFDNTYSWIHTKEVYYKCSVISSYIKDNNAS